MRNLLLLIGAATMAVSVPAAAQGQGKGKSQAAKTQNAAKGKGQARTNVRAQNKASTARNSSAAGRVDANRNGILDRFERDTDGDGILDYREGRLQRTLDRNGNGILDRYESGSRNVNFCPPGLANKTPACIPPGQARQMYSAGQRLPSGYRYVTVPQQYISQIPSYDPNRYRYYYDQQRVYVVDPTTRLISSVIDLVL
ncbi:MAG TPA: hypothetical protein VGD10_06820 [Allosphingosinicella sp.]|uniref:hypothetical protein n=1 Tax=Allosphingosinicella sp. TaxID=2823234 RepID=UPI002EDBA6D8